MPWRERVRHSDVSFQAPELKSFAYAAVHREVIAGLDRSRELLVSFGGKVAGRCQIMANALENAIPKYESFVVTEFQTKRVQEELVDTPWNSFAADWVVLSKLYTSAKSLSNDTVGKFEIQYESVSRACERAMVAGKTFVAIVSTVTLILKTLPQTVANKRAQAILSHQEKCKSSNLPANLTEYLARELKKSSKAAPPA